jgi:hypothetical protein
MTILESSLCILLERYFEHPHVLGIHDVYFNDKVHIIIQIDSIFKSKDFFPSEINGIPILVETASLAETQSE